MTTEGARAPEFGPNAWLVDEMYERYREDPASVGASWQEFFSDYRPASGRAAVGSGAAPVSVPGPPPNPVPVRAPVSVAGPPPSPVPVRAPDRAGDVAPATPAKAAVGTPSGTAPQAPDVAAPVLLVGAAARVAANMEASLAVPSATSVRTVPARLIEVNRTLMNEHLVHVAGTKVSFTHLIAFAVVRALCAVPEMTRTYIPDAGGAGKAGVEANPRFGLGIAVDHRRADGSRLLLVPCVKDAGALDFSGFHARYEELLRKVRSNTLGPDDFSGVTVTVTNPGTIGTEHSVPRLMANQSAIVGVGALGYPAGFEGADPAVLAGLGLSKTVTLTSTYDHRVIQGALSGEFLGVVHELLLGADGFYDDVFTAMGVPSPPFRWEPDRAGPAAAAPASTGAAATKDAQVWALANMYRVRGHLIADLDPLRQRPAALHPELDPATYGLTIWDLDRRFGANGPDERAGATLGEVLAILRAAYCATVGVEYMHISDPSQKRWIQEHVEGVDTRLTKDEQRHLLDRLNAAEAFERFLHSRYVGQKRFGLEGAEAAICVVDAALNAAADAGVSEVVVGMAHRGRLNVLANVVGKSYEEIFGEFEGVMDPDSVQGSGDVKYHKGATGTFVARSGARMEVILASNPSHLEAVDAVVEGMARARQEVLTDRALAGGAPGGDDTTGGQARAGVLALLLHGDAAFAGQGVVAETLNLSQIPGYRTGGTVHLVINNQVGFTTNPVSSRSSRYPTDVAKMVQAPIFHVNGDDPEACWRVGRLALAFREAFAKDVVIDMVCYRRHGHNEGDDPSYTQPLMYRAIDEHRSVRKRYTEILVRRGDITLADAETSLDAFGAMLQRALDETRSSVPPAPAAVPAPPPVEERHGGDTDVSVPALDRLVYALHAIPAGFTPHPKLARQLAARADLYRSGEVDWSLAEALAFTSLAAEGVGVRLSGQDTRRGTFSHRHAVWVDYDDGSEHHPWAAAVDALPGRDEGTRKGAARMRVYDSLLSEYAVLAFEYGYSVAAHDALVAWEAQFGDFGNGAQVVIDNFVVAADDKWGQESGLVMLLPHGYEGQGPEHSSARIERFLALAAGGNIVVAQPTTAAQLFHLLRWQARARPRRPLIVATPKSLLRARTTRSKVTELSQGAFRNVIDDPALAVGVGGQRGQAGARAEDVQRVVLASGRVAIEALARRDAMLGREGRDAGGGNGGAGPVGDARVARPAPLSAIVRVERLYPWPAAEVGAVLGRYPKCEEVVWLQDEPDNMGAYPFVATRLAPLVPAGVSMRAVCRVGAGSPATGVAAIHHVEEESLMERALGN